MGGNRGVFRRAGGGEDRGVAGAAAEVACELDLVICCAVEMVGGHRGDEAGGAEATLGAVVVDHRLLHGMQGAIGSGDAFHRADGFALQLGKKENAGVERTRAALVGHHNGAGAAIAFVAAFFCSCEVFRFAQPVEECGGGRNARGCDLTSVEKKGDVHHVFRRGTDARCWPPSMRRRSGAG